MSEQVKVFKRRAWRKDSRGEYVPDPGARKTTVGVFDIDDARRMCRENNQHRPAYGTKKYFEFVNYEFTSC